MTVSPKKLAEFRRSLTEHERSRHTVEKYIRDAGALLKFVGRSPLTKETIICFKSRLCERYAPASVNSILAAVNSFLEFLGRPDLRVRLLRIQRATFSADDRELSHEEYERLVRAAQRENNERLSLVVQTICSTGIRVSELRFVTAEAVAAGRAEIDSKGKHRVVFLPEALRELLKKYLIKQKITAGAVFVTRNGRPIDRSNIWRDMKRLCEAAEIPDKKVFPHNLRHLFARTYYSLEKDLSRLADILGHSSVTTTRIYTMESGYVHARQVERLGLVFTT